MESNGYSQIFPELGIGLELEDPPAEPQKRLKTPQKNPLENAAKNARKKTQKPGKTPGNSLKSQQDGIQRIFPKDRESRSARDGAGAGGTPKTHRKKHREKRRGNGKIPGKRPGIPGFLGDSRSSPVPGVALGFEEHPAEPLGAVLAHEAVGMHPVGPILPHQARRDRHLRDALAVQELRGGKSRENQGNLGEILGDRKSVV